MYSNNILRTKSNIVETDLQELEKEFNFILPSSLKEHYLLYNGGYPEKSLFIKDDNTYVVDYFIPVKNDTGQNIFNILHLLNDENILPKWLIPFADEDGGNLFCISIREEDKGAIYYYKHEFEYGDNPENHIEYLSQSLLDFINSLIEYDDE